MNARTRNTESEEPKKQNVIGKVSLAIFGVLAICTMLVANKIWETNSAGYIQIKQAAGTGQMTVVKTPGMYLQAFGTITDYKMLDTYEFDRIKVKFNDGSTALINGAVQYSLPTDDADLLKIHTAFGSNAAMQDKLIKRVVLASLMQSANLFRAEDIYSRNRSALPDLVTDQIREGLYQTTWSDEWVKDTESDKESLVRKVEVKRDATGHPIVNDVSAFKLYNVDMVGQVVINDIDFDDITDGLITKRKEAEQNQVVARANAERAKQDAITAMEEGKRDIARAEAAALVEQKKAVVEAEKDTKVAQQQALQAEEQKKAIIAKGEADAASTKLKVAAGLSPLEKAMIDKETAIGVAAELSKVKLPKMMVFGGGAGQGVDPWTAVGLESYLNISKHFAKPAQE